MESIDKRGALRRAGAAALAACLCAALAACLCATAPAEAHAATKTPAKVKTVKASKRTDSGFTVAWPKAPGAKKYQVAISSGRGC